LVTLLLGLVIPFRLHCRGRGRCLGATAARGWLFRDNCPRRVRKCSSESTKGISSRFRGRFPNAGLNCPLPVLTSFLPFIFSACTRCGSNMLISSSVVHRSHRKPKDGLVKPIS